MEFSSGRADGAIGETMEALLANGFEKELVLDAAIAQSDSQRAAFWKLRELLSDSQRPEGGSIKCDTSVPVPKKIGRASWRERGCQYVLIVVVAVYFIKKY